MLFSNEFPFYFLWMGNPFDTQAMIRIPSGLVMYGTYGWKRCVICRCHWDPIWFYPSGWCNNRVGQVSCSLDSFQVITESECPSDRIEYNEATSEKEKFFEKKISWITLAIEALFLSHTFTVFFPTRSMVIKWDYYKYAIGNWRNMKNTRLLTFLCKWSFYQTLNFYAAVLKLEPDR